MIPSRVGAVDRLRVMLRATPVKDKARNNLAFLVRLAGRKVHCIRRGQQRLRDQLMLILVATMPVSLGITITPFRRFKAQYHCTQRTGSASPFSW